MLEGMFDFEAVARTAAASGTFLRSFRDLEPPFAAALDIDHYETGKAIIMAALTAIVGYGSFAISHYPGLRSIGYASTFGIGLSGLAAITLLPAILVLNEGQGDVDDTGNTRT